MRKYIYLFALTILLQACEGCNCPDDIDIGDCYLTDNSVAFVPYISGESIKFSNALGETEDLDVTRNIHDLKLELNRFCSKGFLNYSIEYVDSNLYTFDVKNDSINMRIQQNLLQVELTNPTEIDSNYIDIIIIEIQERMGLFAISDNRGKTPLNNMSNIFHNSIQVVDSTFTNVYATADSTFLYNKSVGLVGFKYHDEMYRFKKVN
jgi:hypothetical protein